MAVLGPVFNNNVSIIIDIVSTLISVLILVFIDVNSYEYYRHKCRWDININSTS